MIVSCIPLRIRRSAQSFLVPVLRRAGLAMCLTLGVTVASAHAAESKTKPVPLAQIDPARLAEIEAMLKTELQHTAGRFEGQGDLTGNGMTIDVRIETRVEGPWLVIDLGEEYGPLATSPDMEDLQSWLTTTALDLLRDVVPIKGVEFLYGGNDMYYYHPEEWRVV